MSSTMNFEGLEQWRAELTQETMQELVKIIKDTKIDAEQRVNAARVVDAMSDSIIKANLMSEVTHANEDNNKNLHRKLDKLIDDEK